MEKQHPRDPNFMHAIRMDLYRVVLRDCRWDW